MAAFSLVEDLESGFDFDCTISATTADYIEACEGLGSEIARDLRACST